MTPGQVVVGIVSEGPTRAALVAAIEAAGATFEVCNETTAIARAGDLDAIIFDVGTAPERHATVAIALATDPRTRWVPRLLIVAGETPVERVAAFGLAMIIPVTASAETVALAIAGVVERVRVRSEIDRQAAIHHADLRSAEQDLIVLQRGGDALSHDARVLFGVIMGFASNLRDGIAGPVVDLQRTHAANVVEAVTDAAALLDRHITALRATVREPPELDPAAAAAVAAAPRRRQNDLAELVRATVALFAGIAAAKRIRLQAVAPRAIVAWCDAMQIKQVLVNLLANALKFTPPDGVVEVAVGPGAPASSRGGGTARREVELVVSDSGPGIPEDERERVFERGVRLGRDSLVPGTGLGLAVVRDIVELHGGAVHIEPASSLGGAAFVVTLPTDLRSRAADHRQQSASAK